MSTEATPAIEPNRWSKAARARWDRLTDDDARRAATAAAVAARPKVADVAVQLETLGAQLKALQAEVADLRQQQMAA